MNSTINLQTEAIFLSGTCLVSFGYPTDEKHTHQRWKEFELDAKEAVDKFNQLYAKALNAYGYPSEEHLFDHGATLEAVHSWVEADRNVEYVCVAIEFPK